MVATATVAVPCRSCGSVHELHPSIKGWISWQNGELIQNAMPELNASERELLISGTCQKCWDELFPSDEDE